MKLYKMLFALMLLLLPAGVQAANIDPENYGYTYAWGENIGWLNFSPSYGPGVTVTDAAVTGYAWGENIGWINLSPAYGGVVNDGNGNLSGYAWAENAGWINFSPSGGGVSIDACGDFNGMAWGENIGWINFRSDGVNPFGIRSLWASPIDGIAPITEPASPVRLWYNADISLTLNAADCGTGAKEVRHSLNGSAEAVTAGSSATVSITSEGANTLNYYSIDLAGNIEPLNTITLNLDKTAPAINISNIVDGTTYDINQAVAPTFTVDGTGSSVVAVTSTVPSGIAIDTTTEGAHTFTVTATDTAGNTTTTTYTYYIVYPGNMDAGGYGRHYAWNENTGWINLKPSYGPGVTVTDAAVSGYAWGENIGWINLGPAYGGVVNDALGNLSGYAWAENAGWINFSPVGAGVTIDPATGVFAGMAWGENIGWISFSGGGAANYGANTAWRGANIALAVTPSIPGGTYTTAPRLTLAANKPSTIYYTLDGTEPTAGSTAYTGAIPVNGTATVKYFAVDASGNSSAVTTEAYTVTGGNLMAWGWNSSGQLGDGSVIDRLSPVQDIGVVRVAALTAGEAHAVALKNDGTVWTWGQNRYGALGDGTFTDSLTEVNVQGLADIVAVSSKFRHTLALKSDGTVWAWGWNLNGELGDGTVTPYSPFGKPSPAQVPGIGGITDIAAGLYHSLALKDDGTVLSWGRNNSGALGDGTAASSSSPVQVGGLTDVVTIAAGWEHSVALKADGTVWTWGYGGYGQLGNGNNAASYVPVQVGGLTDVAAIAGGGWYTLALKNDGSVWIWGLTDMYNTTSMVPVPVSGMTGAVALADGGWHTLILKNDGTVWAWGSNAKGQLGDGTSLDNPVAVRSGALTGVSAVAGGNESSFAIVRDSTPPLGSITIDGGAAYTNSTTVTLWLDGATDDSGVISRMCLSEDDATWSCSTYNPTFLWHLSPGDGLKSVYVKYMDPYGNTSPSYSASITQVIDSGLTPAGTPVVRPVDTATGTRPVTLNFAGGVTAGGTTTVTSASSTAPPAGFLPGTPPVFYEINTTAAFNPPVEVCIDYSGSIFADTSALQIAHGKDMNGNGTVDANEWTTLAATTHDQANRVICALTDSFSVFGVVAPIVTAANDSATTPEDTPVVIDVLANDSGPAGVTPAVTIATQPASGTAAVNTDGTVTYTPSLNFNGADSFTYNVSAAGGSAGPATVSVTVTPVNDAPVANPAVSTGAVFEISSFFANATDPEGDALTYLWDFNDPISTVKTSTAANPLHTYVAAGTYNVTLTVSDGKGGADTVTLAVAVNAPPLPQPGHTFTTDCANCHLARRPASHTSNPAAYPTACETCHQRYPTWGRVDTTPPAVTAPPDVTATVQRGTLTPLTDLGAAQATAVDNVDGAITPVAGQTGPFAPGAYAITWSATDSAGNTGTALQRITLNTPADVFGVAMPNGSTVDLSTSGGEPISNVMTAPYTSSVAGVDFSQFGTISYSATASSAGSCVTTGLTFSSALPVDLVLYKIDNSGALVGQILQNADPAVEGGGWILSSPSSVALTICDNGVFDLNAAPGIIEDPVAVGEIFNKPPVAYGGVDKSISCVWSTCVVTLDGSGSTDPDGTADITDYGWYKDYGKPGEVLLAQGPSPSATVSLPLGTHEITLAVTDSIVRPGPATDTFTVDINPAALSLFEVKKAEVEWDKKKIKLNGTIALPVGRSYLDIGTVGSIAVDLSTLGAVVDQQVAFTANDSGGRKWKYRGTNGTAEFKIDWKGERFDYNQEIRLKSNHIGQDSTNLEIDRKGVAGPLNIVIAGAVDTATIDIDAAGVVTTTPAGLKVDADDDGEVEVGLPFQLLPEMTITVSGAVSTTVNVADHYTAAIGKYEVESSFDPGPTMGDVRPAYMKVDITLGDVMFPGSATINEPGWTKLRLKEWKMKR